MCRLIFTERKVSVKVIHTTFTIPYLVEYNALIFTQMQHLSLWTKNIIQLDQPLTFYPYKLLSYAIVSKQSMKSKLFRYFSPIYFQF